MLLIRFLLALLISFLIQAANFANAQAQESEKISKEEINKSNTADNDDWIGQFHQSVTEGVYQSALWFDDFFLEDDSEQLNPKTSARIRLSWRPQSRDWGEYKARFKIKVRLPNFKNKVDLILSDDDETNLGHLPLENNDAKLSTSDEHFAAAVRYVHKKQEGTLTDSRIGISGGDIFLRARHQRRFVFNNKHSIKVEPSLYYFLDDGLSERLLLEYDYQVNKTTQYRINYSIRGSQTYSGIRWKHGFYKLRQLDSTTASLTSLQVEGQRNGEESFLIERYYAGYRYRFNAYRKWLFFEVEPFLEWHEEDNYSTSPGIALRVEGFFAKG